MEKKLSAEQIIEFISQAKKVTPVKVYVKGTGVASLSYGTDSKVFGEGNSAVVFGEWSQIEVALKQHAELVNGLKIVSNHVYVKYEGNAFSNAKLEEFLQSEGIQEIEVIGVDGGGCVSLTALGAIDNGYKVTLNTTCIGTVFKKQRDKYYEKLREKGATII